jgi:hypothetical protein
MHVATEIARRCNLSLHSRRLIQIDLQPLEIYWFARSAAAVAMYFE